MIRQPLGDVYGLRSRADNSARPRMLSVNNSDEDIGSDASEGSKYERSDHKIELKIGHSRSLPRTICAVPCSANPPKNQSQPNQRPLATRDRASRGRARDGAGGKTGRERIEGVVALGQFALDVRHDVHHVAVALDEEL